MRLGTTTTWSFAVAPGRFGPRSGAVVEGTGVGVGRNAGIGVGVGGTYGQIPNFSIPTVLYGAEGSRGGARLSFAASAPSRTTTSPSALSAAGSDTSRSPRPRSLVRR